MFRQFNFSSLSPDCLPNTNSKRRRWQPLIISRLILGLCVCLASSCGSSTPEEKPNMTPLHETISTPLQSSHKKTSPSGSSLKRRSLKTSRTDNSTSMRTNQNSTELAFKIVAFHRNVHQILERSKNDYDQTAKIVQKSVDSTLQQKFAFYVPGSVRIDLKQKTLSLRLTSTEATDLVRKINESGFQMVTIAPLEQTLRETLVSESGEASLVKQELHCGIYKISPEYQTQLDQNYQIGSEALRLLLNERFKNSVPEYVPDSLRLNMNYRRVIFQVITYPSFNLCTQINSLYELPVTIGGAPYRTIELRTEQQLKPTQVTYQITSIDEFENNRINDIHTYTTARGSLMSNLINYLETKVTGYITGSLDINLQNKTVTFQLDHVPDHRLSEGCNEELFVNLKISDTPILIEPPGPVFRTPNRPMKRVTLKIENADELLTSPFYRNKALDSFTLQSIHSELNFRLRGSLPGYFEKTVRANFKTMELAFLLDRVPPVDLTKMVNGIRSLGVIVADELVSVEDVEYDPESFEKTMYFSFTDTGQHRPEFDEIDQTHSANTNLCGVEGYIPHTIHMDHEQGTLNFKIRVGGDETKEIEYVTNALAAIKLECKHLSTTLPESSGKGNPLQSGMTAKRSAEPALVKENVKVTVKYGLYADKAKGKPQVSARDALNGFSWIDLKTLQFDAEKKEFSFKTTGPYNRGALERSLKRQKFYQCVISHEALPKIEEPKE